MAYGGGSILKRNSRASNQQPKGHEIVEFSGIEAIHILKL
jgi:hypothetical protein